MEKLEQLAKEMKGHGPGAEQAFQELYESTRKTALAVIRRYCDIEGDYEDLLQETYIRVYRSIDTLRDETRAAAWINKIAANTATRHNMKKWPKMFSELMNEEGDIPDFKDVSGEFDPEVITDKKAVAQAVNQVIDTLPPDQRAALWMVYGQQITIKEMAESLGISENTIKSRLYQGKNKLLARKDEFRRLGVELTAIPVAALISLAFRQDVYAAVAAGAAVGGAAVSGEAASGSAAASGKAAAGNTTTGSAVSGVMAACTSVFKSGMALGTKFLLGAAAVAVIGGSAIAVKANTSSYMEPVKLKITGYNNRDYGMAKITATYYPEEVSKQVESLLQSSGSSLDAINLERWENGSSNISIFLMSDDSTYNSRYGEDWKISCKKLKAERLKGEDLEALRHIYRNPMTAYGKSDLPLIFSSHSEEKKKLDEYFDSISVTDAYELKLLLTIKGSKQSSEAEKKAIVVKYGGDWVLYPGQPDDLVYNIDIPLTRKVSADTEQTEPESGTESSAEPDTDQDTKSASESGIEQETSKAADAEDDSVTYGRPEDNAKALSAYRDALLHNKELIAPDNEWGDISKFVLEDINSDGIQELYVFVPGLSNAETKSYLLYYSDGLKISEPLSWSFGVIAEDNAFISAYSHMSEYVSYYRFDGTSLTQVEEFYYEVPDSLEYANNPAKNDRLAAKAEAWYEKASWPDWVAATEENIRTYLGGSDAAEIPASGSADVDAAAARLSFDMDEEIQFIRDTYAYTNEHIGEYRKGDGFPESYGLSMTNVKTWSTADGTIVKHVSGGDSLTVEAYHLNPALGRTSEVKDILEFTVIFVFAHDTAGNEYRLYFKDSQIIRYIGPDKKVVDYPEGIDYGDFNARSSELSGGDQIWSILVPTAPMWWTSYEGEGE